MKKKVLSLFFLLYCLSPVGVAWAWQYIYTAPLDDLGTKIQSKALKNYLASNQNNLSSNRAKVFSCKDGSHAACLDLRSKQLLCVGPIKIIQGDNRGKLLPQVGCL